jgi:DNA-directed RNA polymerase specialized sigma24 family protein
MGKQSRLRKARKIIREYERVVATEADQSAEFRNAEEYTAFALGKAEQWAREKSALYALLEKQRNVETVNKFNVGEPVLLIP